MQRAIRGAVGHTKRRSLRERHALGQAVQLRWTAARALGVGSGAGDGVADAADVHAIAGLDSRHVRADRFDLAGAVLAGRVRQHRLARVEAGAEVGVDWVDAGGAHTHHDLAGSRRRIGNIFQFHNGGTAELVYSNRLHLSSLLMGWCPPSGGPDPGRDAREGRLKPDTPELPNARPAWGCYHGIFHAIGEAPQDGRREGRSRSGRRRRARRRAVDDDDRHGRRRARPRGSASSSPRPGRRWCASPSTYPEAAAAVPGDQAADARRRLHGAAHRRLSLQRPPAAHAASPTARGRSTGTASIRATSAPAGGATSSSRRSARWRSITAGRCASASTAARSTRSWSSRRCRRTPTAISGKIVGGDHQRVHGALGDRVDRARDRERPAQGPDHHLVQDVAAARPHRRLPRAGAADRSAAAPRADRGGHGHQGAGLVGVGDGRAAQRGHRRHDSRVADAAARRRSPRGGLRRLRAAAGARAAVVFAERHRLPGLRPHDELDVPGAGRADPGLHPRA